MLGELKTRPTPPPDLTARELIAVGALFVALTLVATYPQVVRLSSGVGTHFDALFSIWRLAWIAHQLPRDPVHLFDGNIFYPERNALAYSDAMLLLGLVGAPFMWLGVSPIVVHNVLLLLSFVAAGVGMYVLVRSLTGSKLAALFSSIPFAFQAYRFAHYPQLELLWTCFIPLALWALHRALATGRVRHGMLIGLFTGLQALTCLYYAVFLTTALAIVSGVMVLGRRRSEIVQLLKPAAAAIVVCVLITAVYAVPYLEVREIVGPRMESEIRFWSPSPKAYLATTINNWLYGRLTEGIGYIEGTLFLGLIPVALAGVALFRRWSREVLAYLVLLVICFDLSLGLNGWLYSSLYAIAFPYQGLRVPARIFVVVSTAVCVLSGFGLARLLTVIRRPVTAGVVASVLMAVAFVESLVVPMPLDTVVSERTKADQLLAGQPRTVVLEWPVPLPHGLGGTRDASYMLRSRFHWQPLVNGYSGYHPRSYLDTLERMKRFPSGDTIRHLQRVGVRYIVLHSAPDVLAYLALQEQLLTIPEVQIISLERVPEGELALYMLREP